MSKTEVGLLGATGMVGQRFVTLLDNHPDFKITELISSKEEAEKTYAEAMKDKWMQTVTIPEKIAKMIIKSTDDKVDCRVIFSSIPADIAFDLELKYHNQSIQVISNASAHRVSKYGFLMVPEVNGEMLELLFPPTLDNEPENERMIITNPNCSTAPLTILLAALAQFEPTDLMVTTMQATSGAGYAAKTLDIDDNVIPYIGGEEEKIETETKQITGMNKLNVSASCNRVNVTDGHLESVSIKFNKKPTKEELINALKDFEGLPQKLKLYSAPQPCIVVRSNEDRPQPKLDRMEGKGMATVVGRIRKCSILDWKMTVLSHNTIRGAAGAAVLNAELLKKKSIIF